MSDTTVIIEESGAVEVVTVGIQGPAGPPGEGSAAGTWATAGGLRIRESFTLADADEIVNEWGLEVYPDAPAAGFLRGRDGVVRAYLPERGYAPEFRLAVTTPEDGNLFAAPRRTVQVQGVPEGIYWCAGGPIVDCGNGRGLMALHVEFTDEPIDVGGFIYWGLDAALVEDDGENITVTYLGPLQRHHMSFEEAEATGADATQGSGSFLRYGDTVYLYHYDASPGDMSGRGAVSKASLSDIEEAVWAETPYVPAFHKWNGEALEEEWTQPTVGGEFTPAPPGTGLDQVARVGDFLALPDGRIAAAYIDGDASGWRLGYALGTDPLTFEDPVILVRRTDREMIYPSFWSGDPESPKVLTSETAVINYVTSLHNEGQYRWDTHAIEQTEVIASTADLSPYQSPRTYLRDFGEMFLDLDGMAPGLVVVITPGAQVRLPPTGDIPQEWTILNGTVFAGGGDITVVAAEGQTILAPGQPMTLGQDRSAVFTSVHLAGGWIGRFNGSAGDDLITKADMTARPSWGAGIFYNVPVNGAPVPSYGPERLTTNAGLNGTIQADEVWWIPFQVPADVNVWRAWLRVEEAVPNETATISVVRSRPNLWPDGTAKVIEVSVPLDPAGDKYLPFGDTTLEAGTLYWISFHTPVPVKIRGADIQLGGAVNATARGFYTPDVPYSDGLPATPTISVRAGATPKIGLEVRNYS